MDFTVDSEQKALRDAVREMARRLTPAEARGVRTGPPQVDRDAWSAIVEMGLPGLTYAEAEGGLGAGLVEVALAAAELGAARVCSPLADVLLAGTLLARLGDPSRRTDLLPALVEGSTLLVAALAEPGRAWSTQPHTMAATERSDGWRLDGVKEPVPWAGDADHLVVTARTEAGTGVFLVDGSAGVGARVALSDTPAELLAVGADADRALVEAVGAATVAVCAEALGAMDAAVRMTSEYLMTRQQFGVPLAAFQALTHRAADMYVSLELARSTVLHAAMALTDDPGDSATVSRTKVLVGRAGRHIGQEAIQLHGGIGVTAEYAVGHLTARLTAIEHSYGDTRHHLGRLAADVAGHESVTVLR